MNLGNQPVEILIEDVYLLVTPSPQGEEDPEDEVNRAHAAKMEWLENAELLHMRSQSEVATTGSCSLLSVRSCLLSAHHSERSLPMNSERSLPMNSELSAIGSICRSHHSRYLMYILMS